MARESVDEVHEKKARDQRDADPAVGVVGFLFCNIVVRFVIRGRGVVPFFRPPFLLRVPLPLVQTMVGIAVARERIVYGYRHHVAPPDIMLQSSKKVRLMW